MTSSDILAALRQHFGSPEALQQAISEEVVANPGLRRMQCVALLYRRLAEAGHWNPRQVDLTPPALVCWEHQAGCDPIRLSFSIKVF